MYFAIPSAEYVRSVYKKWQTGSGAVQPAEPHQDLNMVTQLSRSSKTRPRREDPLSAWPSILAASLTTLRRLAGATEHEFLRIGSRMQDMYQQSLNLAQTAQHLVETASGERLQSLIERLREILLEMAKYLTQAQTRSGSSSTTLNSVGDLLKQAADPLSGVRRMCKNLYILEVSIKIESAYLGEMGSEFTNLAIDIKKLSHQIKEKVNAIQELRGTLATTIINHRNKIEAAKIMEDAETVLARRNTTKSLGDLEAVNDRFSQLGAVISSISAENTINISAIVQSMQFHDIFRQQVEHVVEAIEGLLPSLTAPPPDSLDDDPRRGQVISKVGDVCELQQAQLQFASAELYSAVVAIVGNLRSIGDKQQQMARAIYQQTGEIDAAGASFIEEVSLRMNSLATLLDNCADSNSEITGIMREVSGTVGQITGFVADIDEIGHDIIQIALNARIKAATTGRNGASLSVLAEEIGQMSTEAVQRTDLITATLGKIDSTTDTLSVETKDGDKLLSTQLAGLKTELANILAILDEMGGELLTTLAEVRKQVTSLTGEIASLTTGIDIHEQTKAMADEVLRDLKEIFIHARALHPASAAFKEDLRLMAQRYTMESERRIHESIAIGHGVGTGMVQAETVIEKSGIDSEFGDNVDLF
jgi:methyl-accepting chemotaxis protein